MKVLPIFLLSFVGYFVNAQTNCTVFSCGGITQTEGQTWCVFGEETASPTLTTQNCNQDGQHCDAFKWNSPADAGNATCGTEAPATTWPSEITFVAGAGLDGDYCNETANCFSSDWVNPTCTDNVCVSNITTGAVCNEDKDCPRDSSCVDNDGTKTCTAFPAANSECTDAVGCAFGSTCVTLEGRQGNVCTAAFSLANGVNYTLTGEQGPTDGTLFATNLCDSGAGFRVNATATQCRPANRNKDESLTTAEPGQDCVILTNNAPEAANWNVENNITAAETSKCGFNKDEKAYCQVQPGDKMIANDIKVIREKNTGYACHRLSGAADGSTCAGARKFEISKDGFRLFKIANMLASAQASANVANNDRCVAETIMADFWQGQFGSALAHSVVGACAALFSVFLL